MGIKIRNLSKGEDKYLDNICRDVSKKLFCAAIVIACVFGIIALSFLWSAHDQDIGILARFFRRIGWLVGGVGFIGTIGFLFLAIIFSVKNVHKNGPKKKPL